MSALRYTLVADGTSDRCIAHIINWLLESMGQSYVSQMASPAMLRQHAMEVRWERAVQAFPCDVLFIHRDAEGQGREMRIREIDSLCAAQVLPAHVAVVPVRMTEAWLLIDEGAIRGAADNPSGRVPLALPRPTELEGLPDPKEVLWDLLLRASEKGGRRLQQFHRDLFQRRQRVAELIRDYSQLRVAPAFAAFEGDLRAAVDQWRGGSAT